MTRIKSTAHFGLFLIGILTVILVHAGPVKAFFNFGASEADIDEEHEDSAPDGDELEDFFDPSKYELHPAPRRRLQGSAPGFKIDLVFESSMSQTLRDGFIAARDKWMSVITSDLASTVCVRARSRVCGRRVRRRLCWDDLLIFARVGPIDGGGNIAGYAGPCGFSMGMPRVGEMVFDIADVGSVVNAGVWRELVLHEMGHVLGFGTLWESRALLTPVSQGTPFYLGANGLAGLRTLTGNSGSRLAVEDEGGAGSVRGHWKEATYNSEVMTSVLDLRRMPLSLITVRAMQDLGYTVNLAAAESYLVGSRPAKEEGSAQEKSAAAEASDDGEFHLDLSNDIRPQNDIVELKDVKPKRGREAEFERLKAKFEARKAGKEDAN